ncbi:e3 ubiquitin-protein ligase ari8 [Hordeum vulgare]|nr:e3 ubiquitin-protein ligase ari8 [Hordeum vulgare]
MWSHKADEPWKVLDFYRTTHEDLWRVLLKLQQEFQTEDEDVGLDDNTPPMEEWLELAKNIEGPAPLPEEPQTPLLELMLVESTYVALDNKKKETRGGLHSRGPPDTKSEDTQASSTHKGGVRRGGTQIFS